MTAIFLAWNGNAWAHSSLVEWDWENRPVHMLCSYAYLKAYRKAAADYGRPLSAMLDSGAFTAWKSGIPVDLDAYINEVKTGGCTTVTGEFFQWDQCVALDVIGDSEGSVKNAHYMREQGLNVIPVFHYGEPWEILHEYCEHFPHVGLSCRFGEPVKKSIAWVEQCFSREWPHLFHSFGWVDLRILDRVPFDTADAATWQLAPTAFGFWKSYGAKLSVRCNNESKLRLFTELEYYLDMQRHLEERWTKELKPLRLATLGESLTKRRTLWT